MDPEAEGTPHDLSAERLKVIAEALQRFATAYLDQDVDDVSAYERAGLARAAELADKALDVFSWSDFGSSS